jgi:hypothetical protein
MTNEARTLAYLLLLLLAAVTVFGEHTRPAVYTQNPQMTTEGREGLTQVSGIERTVIPTFGKVIHGEANFEQLAIEAGGMNATVRVWVTGTDTEKELINIEAHVWPTGGDGKDGDGTLRLHAHIPYRVDERGK